jgi:hypothetical protein
MSQWIVSGMLGFVAGAAFVWFCKSFIQRAVIGANALSAKLHAEANALTTAVKKL